MQPSNHSPQQSLFDAIDSAAARAREESVRNYGQLWEAYSIFDMLLTSLVEQGAADPDTVSKSASERISLTSNLIQSTTMVEGNISSGFYWAAAAVLRQQMETLARVILIRTGHSSTESKSPNVKVLPLGLNTSYGRLSELAHVSNGELLHDFALGESGESFASPVPTFRKAWSHGLFSQHITQLVVLAREIDYLHQELSPGKPLVDIETPILKVLSILYPKTP